MLLGSALASLGDTQMGNLKLEWVPGVRIIQTCGLAEVPWGGARFFLPLGLIPIDLAFPLSAPPPPPPRQSMSHTHPLHLLPCSVTVNSSQQLASQNLTKKSEEMRSAVSSLFYNVPKNSYREPKLSRIESLTRRLPV